MKLLQKRKVYKSIFIITCIAITVILIVLSNIKLSGFQDGYKDLPLAYKSKIMNLSDEDIYDAKYKGFVFKINAKDILSLIKQDEYSLVYLWHPNCPHDTVSIENLCNTIESTNLKLYIISDSYAYLFDFYSDSIKNKYRMFIVDGVSYKTNIRYLYMGRFLKELIGKKESCEFLLFEDGNFARESNDLSELLTLTGI